MGLLEEKVSLGLWTVEQAERQADTQVEQGTHNIPS
jgi:hypothetical protein